MTWTAPCSKLGKRECATGVVKAPNADIKVTVGTTRPATVLHAPVTMGTLQPLITQTFDNQVRLGYNLLPTRDGQKTVLPHP